MDHPSGKSPVETVTTVETTRPATPQQEPSNRNVTNGNDADDKALPSEDPVTADDIEESKKGLFSYLKTRNFYIVLATGSGILRRIIPLHSPPFSKHIVG